MKVGVFFHPHFSELSWPIIGDKFKNFPKILKGFEGRDDVVIITPAEPNEELILLVHDQSYINSIRDQFYFRAATLSVAGVQMALEMIRKGGLLRAFVFSCASGHHAGRASGWGGTYLSCIGPPVYYYWKNYGRERFAIIDTDSHHGDGTREIFLEEKEVLHVCFCSENRVEGEGQKIDVDVGWRTSDKDYLDLVQMEFYPRVKSFRPYLIFHNFGHDTCQGDYGDRGLAPEFFLELARKVKSYADEVCSGRYIIITHGGRRRDVAEYIFPKIIDILAQK